MWATETDQQLHEDLAYAKSAGANVVRLDIAWATLESDGPGVYTRWYADRLAEFMHEAQQLRIKVIGILFTTPCWASSAPESLKQGCQGDWWDRGVGWYPPTNDQDFASFVRFITATYGSELAAVEIWNEPDQPNGAYWKSSSPAADYAQLVKASYPAAKQGDSGVPVLAGSLSGSDAAFLTALFQDGIRGYYDGLSVHPYSDPRPPDATPSGTDVRWEFEAGLQAIHALQLRYGDHTPVWVTEIGWNTVNSTQQQQATYISQSYRILAQMTYVEAGIVYELHDDIGGNAQDPGSNYGLMGQNYSPKPAYAAFASVMTAPTAPVLVAPAGGATIRENHPVLSFTASPNSTVTAYIDGVLAGSTSADNLGNASLTVNRRLADGGHSMHATDTNSYGDASSPSSSTRLVVSPVPPVILSPKRGTTSGPSLNVKVAGEPGDTATVCIEGSSCSSGSINSNGLVVLHAPKLSAGRHSISVVQRDVQGVPSPWSPTVSWKVTPDRLRIRVLARRARVMHVRCTVNHGTLERCSVAAYVRGRRVGAGEVQYQRSRHSHAVVAVRWNSLGRRLARTGGRRLGIRLVVFARLAGGPTVKAVLRR